MTDAPEKIWVHYEVETDDATWSEYPDTDGVADFKHYGEYTRTDIAKLAVEILSAHKRTSQAKIAELKNALAAASGTIAAMRADRLADLPDMIAPLDMPERRNNYWGHKSGYQVAHTNEDLFRVRLHGRVICKDIRGFRRAVEWANNHHRAAIMATITGLDP
jgi:hypothetical protein